jgi:hypothetical protein
MFKSYFPVNNKLVVSKKYVKRQDLEVSAMMLRDFLAPHSRITFYVNDWVTDFNVSTEVDATGGGVICERAMYGNNRTWAHDSIGWAP